MDKKMSKSDESDFSRINLLDDKDTISNKIKKAKTDSESIMGLEALEDNGEFNKNIVVQRPEAVNLLNILCAAENISKKRHSMFSGKNFSDLKEYYQRV